MTNQDAIPSNAQKINTSIHMIYINKPEIFTLQLKIERR